MTENFTEKVIKLAQKGGATDAIARHTFGPEYQIRFSNSNIDISKKWDNNLLEIFIAIGKKITQVDIQDPTAEKIEKTVTRALSFAKKMPDSGLYEGIETEFKPYVKMSSLYDPLIESLYERAPDLVNTAINSSLEAGAKRVAGVMYFGDTTTELQTNHGINGQFRGSYYRLTVRSFVDFESSGQDVVVGRKLSDLEKKFAKSGNDSGKLAKMSIAGKQGKAGKYDLIMSPIVAGNVLGQITDGANPLMILMGMSPLGDHFGEQIGPENFTVVDDPHIEEGLGSKPFDVEGTPTNKTPIITNGVLVGLIHNTTSGKMMQSKTTGNSELLDFEAGSKMLGPWPSNMVYPQGNQSLEEMIEDCKKPTIYVTSNWYTRFTNMLEGEFSTIPRDGMFLIEDGEIKKPVRKLRLTDNLLRISRNIDALGNDRKQIYWWEVTTPTFIPTIKIKDCNITAATQ
ncbi:MAG: TldD/PmbA family protein [Candidatus Thorarchaeota archaeon]